MVLFMSLVALVMPLLLFLNLLIGSSLLLLSHIFFLFCLSSLCRAHANLLCIILILLYVLIKLLFLLFLVSLAKKACYFYFLKRLALRFIVPFNCLSQFSRSVMSDPLLPHESQHARPPCPSPSPGLHSDSRPLSQ